MKLIRLFTSRSVHKIWIIPSDKQLVSRSCPTLCDPMDCILLGSSIHGILQARVLQWVAISYSRGIFPTQGLTPSLPYCRQILCCLSHQEAPSDKVLVFSSLGSSDARFLWMHLASLRFSRTKITPDQLRLMLLVYVPPFSLPIQVCNFYCTNYYDSLSMRSLLGNEEFDTCFHSPDGPLKS